MQSRIDIDAAVGQMAITSFTGVGWNARIEELLGKYKIGGLIFFAPNIGKTRRDVKKLTDRIRLFGTESSGGLPPFISVDEEGGRVSRLKNLIGPYPSPMEVAQRNGRISTIANYESLARDVYGLGFNIAWAPALDIHTNPLNTVIGDRAFGDEAGKVTLCGRAALKTLRNGGLLTSAKHFPGHGGTAEDSHKELPVSNATLAALKKRELSPFRMAVAQKVDFIMTAHILFKKIDPLYPATFSKKLITKLLRKEMGYKGLIVTDDLNMKAVSQNFSMEERITLAVNAGADVLLIRGGHREIKTFAETFRNLVMDGKIPLSRIRESLKRIAGIKRRRLCKKPA